MVLLKIIEKWLYTKCKDILSILMIGITTELLVLNLFFFLRIIAYYMQNTKILYVFYVIYYWMHEGFSWFFVVTVHKLVEFL